MKASWEAGNRFRGGEVRGREGQDRVLGKKGVEGLGGERERIEECVREYLWRKGTRW